MVSFSDILPINVGNYDLQIYMVLSNCHLRRDTFFSSVYISFRVGSGFYHLYHLFICSFWVIHCFQRNLVSWLTLIWAVYLSCKQEGGIRFPWTTGTKMGRHNFLKLARKIKYNAPLWILLKIYLCNIGIIVELEHKESGSQYSREMERVKGSLRE